MAKKQIIIDFNRYDDISALSSLQQQLLQEAKEALSLSWSPYSNFRVGAALITADQKIYKGANLENAAYPLCLCAERTVLAAAASQSPAHSVLKMAITVRNPEKLIDQPATPCGACRQVLCEWENRYQQPIELILQGEAGPIHIFKSSADLLPFGFGGRFL